VDAFKPRRDFALPVADALCPPGEHRVTRVCGLVEEAEKSADHSAAILSKFGFGYVSAFRLSVAALAFLFDPNAFQ
jgi:hypothetical protein